ncbi:hypothetical protein Hte_004548 [Hypoxylon texense]
MGCWCPRWLSISEEGFDPERSENNLILEFRHSLLGEARIDVPIALVNTEAQGIAITWAQERSPPIRTHGYGHQLVFIRAFDPDRDTVYVGPCQWDDLLREPFDRLFAPDLDGRAVDIHPGLVRIAMPESLVRDVATTLSELFDHYYDLRLLYIVVDAPPNLSLQAAHDAIAKQRHCQCESSHRVALWTSGYWEFDFANARGDSDRLRRLVESAAQGLRKGLIEMSIHNFGIYFVSVVAVN